MASNDESFNPVEIDLHHLPDTNGTITYDIPSPDIPAEAKSLLIYAFCTTHNKGSFNRGYYEIYTKEGDVEYKMYMNFATGTPAVTISSTNVWLPITSERKIHVMLWYPVGESVAHKERPSIPKDFKKVPSIFCGEWSQLFITGWK